MLRKQTALNLFVIQFLWLFGMTLTVIIWFKGRFLFTADTSRQGEDMYRESELLYSTIMYSSKMLATLLSVINTATYIN
jgi:hypothetical protein